VTAIRRVLLVGPLEGARWRSISAYTRSLQAMLLSAGIEVETAAAPWFNPPSMLAGARARWTAQRQVRASEEGYYDLVHLTDHALGHHVPRFQRGSPVVVTCHDIMPFTVRGYYRSSVEGKLKRAFLQRPQKLMCEADALITVSEFTRGEVLARYGVNEFKVVVVPNMVRAAFRPAGRAEAESALVARQIKLPAGSRIVSVGHTQGYKNLQAVLKALSQPVLAHAQLIRVGSKLSPELLRLAKELGVSSRIHQLGAVSDEVLALVYAASDALAQPSLAEGFGIPVIEAMACGLPVVASDGGALPEVIGDAGIIVPLTPPDFAGRFARALSSSFEQRADLASAGIVRAERYRSRAVLPALLAAYERAITLSDSER
jgi:alpha-1,3-rhamnosyl/mannosyltransferase